MELRKSQVKFQSENYELGICKNASFTQGYLNRQIILLLVALGIPQEVIIKKQDQHLKLIGDVKESLKLLKRFKNSLKTLK